jgi:predicted alpha/beta superfamily hydrolase
MKKILPFLFLFVALYSNAQITKDTISSKKLGEDREIYISLPENFKKDSKKTYPLLLLLDGDYLTEPFKGALQYGNYWDDLPEMIIVGISQNKNSERFDDCKIDETTGLPEGKGSKFFEFIGGELLPYIETKYGVSAFKIVAGHDVTAGFLNFFLYKDNPIFKGYICMSPELSLDMETNIPSRLSTMPTNIFYYLSCAEGDIKKMKEATKMLHQNISSVKNEKLFYKFDEIPGASHYSLVLHSIPKALYHFFSTYQPISSTEYQEKIVKLESGYVDYLKKKYEVTENTLGIKTPIRFNDFRAIESAIVKNKAFNEFEILAQVATKYYPRTMLGEYYLARFYEETGDIKRAVKSYQNAFNLEPIGNLNKDMMLEKADELRTQIKK